MTVLELIDQLYEGFADALGAELAEHARVVGERSEESERGDTGRHEAGELCGEFGIIRRFERRNARTLQGSPFQRVVCYS